MPSHEARARISLMHLPQEECLRFGPIAPRDVVSVACLQCASFAKWGGAGNGREQIVPAGRGDLSHCPLSRLRNGSQCARGLTDLISQRLPGAEPKSPRGPSVATEWDGFAADESNNRRKAFPRRPSRSRPGACRKSAIRACLGRIPIPKSLHRRRWGRPDSFEPVALRLATSGGIEMPIVDSHRNAGDGTDGRDGA